jgi:predicted GNAT family acetyltransferase
MTKPIVRTAQKNMGNMQINTETLSVQQPKIKAMLKGDGLKCCIRTTFLLR